MSQKSFWLTPYLSIINASNSTSAAATPPVVGADSAAPYLLNGFRGRYLVVKGGKREETKEEGRGRKGEGTSTSSPKWRQYCMASCRILIFRSIHAVDLGGFQSAVSHSFLSRVSTLKCHIDIANLSVRPSVCLSVTFRYYAPWFFIDVGAL